MVPSRGSRTTAGWGSGMAWTSQRISSPQTLDPDVHGGVIGWVAIA